MTLLGKASPDPTPANALMTKLVWTAEAGTTIAIVMRGDDIRVSCIVYYFYIDKGINKQSYSSSEYLWDYF